MLDGSGVKAMPEWISTPNSGSLLKNRKIQVAKWGTPKKTLKKESEAIVNRLCHGFRLKKRDNFFLSHF